MFNRLIASIMATAYCWALGSMGVAQLQSDSPYTLTGMWQGQLVLTLGGWLLLLRLIWRKA